MQCQSYLPLYNAHNDLNMDANGSKKPTYSSHAKPQIGDFNQKLMNYGVSEGLHLGYGKEILRQTILQQEVTFKGQVQELHRLYRRQKELLDEIKRSNYYKKNAPSCSTPFDCLDFSHPSAQTPWPSSCKVKTATSASHISVNDLDLSLSNNSTTARRKPLNLHLPADEFINSEGKESFFNDHEVSGLSFLSTRDTKPLLVNTSPTTVSSQMIDLAKFSGSDNTWTGFLNDCPYKKKPKMCKNNMETGNSIAWQQWQPCGEDENLKRLAGASQFRKSASLFTEKNGWLKNGRRDIDGMLDLNTPAQVLPMRSPCVDELDYSSRCGDTKSLQISSSETNLKASSASSGFLFQTSTRVDSIDLNCTEAAASCEETGISDNQGQNKSPMLFDINLPYHEHSNPVNMGSDDDTSPTSASITIPISSEDEVAVDVLLSISSSQAQQKSTGNELLIWFAGLASSMEETSTSRIDYFEAMTLKLTETSDEDYWPNTTTVHHYNDKAMCSRTTKRIKRKNFQKEVLPSLSSLSRYEASEDILMIERLMEAAGTPLQSGVRTRKVRRKQSFRENRTCLLALPCMGIPATDLKVKGCLRWENMPRKPRGKRRRNDFSSTSLSQEGWMKKWGKLGYGYSS